MENLKNTNKQYDHLRTERVDVKTGNAMIDQLVLGYLGGSFCFFLNCFTYSAGFPDMPKFTRRPRRRRTDDAPRIETCAWVKAMSRRIEASVSRDSLFGFVTWNYRFRSSVHLFITCMHTKGEIL